MSRRKGAPMDLSGLIPLLKHFTEIGPPGCALAVSHKGKPVFEHYEGIADKESGRPVDENTLFRMFSNTKNVTAVAALILYERGEFLLNDPLEKYLPCFADMTYYDYDGSNTPLVRPATRPILIKDLFTMCSGLTYGGTVTQTHLDAGVVAANHTLSTLEFAEKLSGIPLAFEPGTHWNYGYSHDVLGALIEAVSGKRFGEFLSDEIFNPLGMKKTFFSLPEHERGHLASQYRVEEHGLVKDHSTDYAFDPSYPLESGGAGLLSTLRDMDTFTRMLSMGGTLNGVRILGRKTIDLMRLNHLEGAPLGDFQKVCRGAWPWFEGYGYGLGVRTMADRAKAGSNGSDGEFGWAGMAGTWLMVDMEEQLSACYLHQLIPSEKNLQDYCHPRIRNAIYGALD